MSISYHYSLEHKVQARLPIELTHWCTFTDYHCFFITENVRGTGLGKVLMQKTIDKALELGYDSMYLESFPTLESAVHLYKKFGFESLKSPLGDTGHHACNVWMTKKL